MTKALNTTVHRLADDGVHCSFCHCPIPSPHRAHGGEYVAITSYNGARAAAYRIGGNNRDPLCTGQPAATFHQDSIT